MWTWNSDPFGTEAANPNPAGAGTFSYNLRFPGQVFGKRPRKAQLQEFGASC